MDFFSSLSLRFLILGLLIASTLHVAQSDDIFGCGGFVSPSAELAKSNLGGKFDGSQVKVKLVTLDGVVKESTPCSPQGYYFIPVYQTGNFLLQVEGPEGWSFEPAQAAVRVEDNQCHSPVQTHEGGDINFRFTGFTITGAVVSKDCGEGSASGVTVNLYSAGKTEIVASTESGQGGKYSFANVFPGKYTIKASHPSWSFVVSSVDFDLKWGNVKVGTDFVVSGFDISGSVTGSDEPKEAVAGVHFLLYSQTQKKIDCSATTVQAPAKPGYNLLCESISDAAGSFHFKNIPCGAYTILPYYKGTTTLFDVSPAELPVNVLGSVVISEAFQVMGFSVSGRVVDAAGKGIPDVRIRVGGKDKTVTDSKGLYKLEHLKSGTYSVEASKDHFFFNNILDQRISASSASLPDITVKSFHLCGKVDISLPPAGVTKKKRSIQLKDNDGKALKSQLTNDDNSFCFEVNAGTYKVSPVIDSYEQEAGLSLMPSEALVTISDSPKLDVIFSQARMEIHGKVKCIKAPCDSSVSVILTSKTNQVKKTAIVGTPAPDSFQFDHVFPGKYQLSVVREGWCWEGDVLNLEVKTEHIKNVEFVQTGYQLSIKSSHALPITSVLDKESQEFNLNKGLNKFCLTKPGIYSVTPKSCYKFDQDVFQFDTSSPKPLDLTARAFQVSGSIEASEKQVPKDAISIKLSTKRENVEPTVQSIEAKFRSSKGEVHTYDYTFFAKVSDEVEITPTHTQLLFYPASRVVQLSSPECPAPLEKFEARPGLFLKGKVEPALDNVKITVSLANDQQVLRETLTTSDGTYSIGPLYDDKQYQLRAEVDGYVIEEKGQGNFVAKKLASVTVTVQGTDSSVVAGVLLSLSGDSYRNNNVTSASGSYKFSNVFPGQYFLRPILKEYVFEPSSQTLTVGDGEQVKVTIKADRVAFSCYGLLTSLNGEPERGITVEAVGPDGEREEAQSNITGHYRLRGLAPGKTFAVSIKTSGKDGGDRIERASPKSFSIPMTKQDFYGADFVVFRRVQKFDISGTVETSKEFLSTLQVSLFKGDDKSTPLKAISLSPSSLFHFPLLQKGKYIVRLQSSLSNKIYSHSVQDIPVDLESDQHLQLQFSAAPLKELQEITSAPLFSLLFGIAILLLGFYYQKVWHFVQGVLKPQPREQKSSNDQDDGYSVGRIHPRKKGGK